jgi:hypothetical protein
MREFPLYVLPTVGYWRDFLINDTNYWNTGETYHKQSPRNHFHIAAANGVMKLTLPVRKETKGGPVRSVELDYAEPWQRKHWQAIESAYRNAPFFEFYGYRFESIWFEEHTTLEQKSLALNELFLKQLGVELLAPQVRFEPKRTLPNKDEWEQVDKPWNQVFEDRYGFQGHVSALDLLFNEGPDAMKWIYDRSASS